MKIGQGGERLWCLLVGHKRYRTMRDIAGRLIPVLHCARKGCEWEFCPWE